MPIEDQKIRVGAVSYLNTKPLVYQLPELASNVDLRFDLPSRLAGSLASSELDVALIPSIELFQHDDYTIVSDACIACRGPVWSVRLLSRKPMENVKTVALDEGSRTSVAMTAILFAERFETQLTTSNLSMEDDPFSVQTDAVLIIGDRAMKADRPEFPYQWDLGEEWLKMTGLPFVFAMWTARTGTNLNGLEFSLANSRDAGLENIEIIASAEHARYDLTYEQTLSYLRDNLHFQLGPQECAGLTLFREHAVKLGLAPENADIQFHDCKAT